MISVLKIEDFLNKLSASVNMGFLGGVKDKFTGGSDDNSDFESSEYDNSFNSDSSSENSSPLEGNKPPSSTQSNSDSGAVSGNSQQPHPKSDLNPPTAADKAGNPKPNQGRSERTDSNRSPNAGAGRPQEGSAEPQLSSDTKRKMEDAGFEVGKNQGGGRQDAGRRNRQGSRDSRNVASNRDDLEEIKSQNEQIIDLLKRINRSVGSQGRERHGGRR